jgi:hypothetical protein
MSIIYNLLLIGFLVGLSSIFPEKKNTLDDQNLFLDDKTLTFLEDIYSNSPENNQIERFRELDAHAIGVPNFYTTDIHTLVNYLIKPASNDIEKTRVIFRWIAENVNYDDHGYNTGNYSDVSAEGVFKNRVAVCDGFSELFKLMGEIAGLEVVKISGYSKGYSYDEGSTFEETNHAWNAIRIDGTWKLFDVTWGQGHGVTEGGQLKSINEFDEFWFATDPYAFIFTHLPEEPKWQLIENPISKRYFERLPYIQSSFFAMGFDGKTVFEQILNRTFKGFPEVYSVAASVRAISMPYNGTLTAGETIQFIIESSGAQRIALINNGNWIFFNKSANTFSIEFAPEKGTLSVSAKLDPNKSSFDRILDYEVK